MNRSPPTYGATRARRPPVCVSCPVSTSVTFQCGKSRPMNDHSIAVLKIEGDVALMQQIVLEVFLDDVTFVAEADDELFESLGRVEFHDVDENRTAANLDHRLRSQFRFFAEPRAEPAGKDHGLHSWSRGHRVRVCNCRTLGSR